MNSTQQRMPQNRLRGLIIYLLLAMALLYIAYSNLMFSKTERKGPALTIISNKIIAPPFNHSSNTSSPVEQRQVSPVVEPPPPPMRYQRSDTQLKHIAFGLASSSHLWETRKEYIKAWWRPNQTRGAVWLDKKVVTKKGEALPEIRVSANTSHFKYSNRVGSRSALRITRVVSETLKLKMKDVRWFVMGDDDTAFIVDNLVRVLSKYDHTKFYYIGSASESHIQNILFSYSMAFGGGGFAISYPLAKELSKMQNKCIQRYPSLYGSDDRIQACMAELGVPLTRELGFHQYDVYGNVLGLLGAHPVTPLVSLHHLDVLYPIFPGMRRARAISHLLEAAKLDSASLMQQSICYDSIRYWSISVSWGYVVQILRGVMSPRELEMPSRTFYSWHKRNDYTAFAFNTRPVVKHPCQKPFLFYMYKVRTDHEKNQTIGIYYHHRTFNHHCSWEMDSPKKLNFVVVVKKTDDDRWLKSPRRDCCRVLPKIINSTLILTVGNCRDGEISELQTKKML
ncbi:Pto-like serine/threonine kinase [Hibiscus syriacus]|uniref:Pto-like serine/threonine kinase n=1 Tax=Hibiscus syriacus TaxID=106335 RepID=A0A6A2ZJE5_HIBSY|nr:uncharacterized protein LOC120145144 [Hibiscus syriacus]KAE8691085.1 Pto-like serine/threonine kinase [Hibiscus syriacus]